METRDSGSEPHRSTRPTVGRWWSDPLALPFVAIVSLAGFVIGIRNCSWEHERHVVLSRVREWELTIRSGRPDPGLFVEGDKAGDEADVRLARQEALADFERLSRVDDFAITDIVVKVEDDTAIATYRLRAVAHVEGGRVPLGGELRFIRSKGRWQIAGHRLIE